MLSGFREHGERPDAIVFADTGGEKPHTYADLWEMQAWCERAGFPGITIVRGEQPQQRIDGTLEAECLRLGALPSKAMGFGACSDKWKRDPQTKWARRWLAERGENAIVKCLGYHAGEAHRAERSDRSHETNPEKHVARLRYPLIEWGWDYEDCEAAILRAGLTLPGKSACFFCPSSKAREILELRDRYPDLLTRALEIERRALVGEGPAPALHTCKGLGRYFSWSELLRTHDEQPDLFAIVPEECSEACFT